MIGQTISHYRVHSKVGEGGMGVVYRAEDLKLGRVVALKFIAPHLVSDEQTRKRFVREAMAAASLDHPNIAAVFEIDEADGTVFLAMSFVEGRALRDLIAERPLKLQDLLDIALQTATALQAAHDRGVIHRDVKPGNLMVTLQGRVKVMDFGLAQLPRRLERCPETTARGRARSAAVPRSSSGASVVAAGQEFAPARDGGPGIAYPTVAAFCSTDTTCSPGSTVRARSRRARSRRSL